MSGGNFERSCEINTIFLNIDIVLPQRLRSLGLISALEEKKSNASAVGIALDRNDCNNDGADNEEWKESGQNTKSRKRKSASAEPREGTRKSLRLQGATIQLVPVNHEFVLVEREERVKECREARLRAANAVAECGGEKAAKENPTATYGHCLMRVKSMTEKALSNRVRAIERCAGKHCVVKMAIFKSCLQDEGLWELAELASDALERLKELKPFDEY